MISYETDMINGKTKICIGSSQLEYHGIVQQLIELPTCYVILLGDWKGDRCADNNIYAIAKEGGVRWNIRDVLEEHLGNKKDLWYPEMGMTQEGLSVLGFNGIRYLIEPEQGTYIGKRIVK